MNTPHATTVSPFSHRWQHYWRGIQFTLTALGAGSRAVGLADNRQVVRDLAAHAASLYP